MHVDVTLAFSQFVGSLPIFVAVLIAWLQGNSRISDLREDLRQIREDIRSLVVKIDLLTGKVAEMDARVAVLEERWRR